MRSCRRSVLRSPDVLVESDATAFVRVLVGTCALPETVELQFGETTTRITMRTSSAARWRFVALVIVENTSR